MIRPFCWNGKFWSCDLDIDFLTYFWNNLTLGINFWTEIDRAFILRMDNLDLQLWPTFEKT